MMCRWSERYTLTSFFSPLLNRLDAPLASVLSDSDRERKADGGLFGSDDEDDSVLRDEVQAG